jgi:hypothetical protein
LTSVRLLIFTLILASRMAAQNLASNKMAANSFPAAPEPASTPIEEPTRPKHRVIDKKFIAVMGALGGAESFRFTTRKLVLEHEQAAGAPWVATVPANRNTVTKDLLLYASEFIVACELRKPHSWLPGDRVIRKLWWVYPAAMVPIHIENAVGNVRTQGPGGCTSIECAEQIQNKSFRSQNLIERYNR